jgi:hypothetical protein
MIELDLKGHMFEVLGSQFERGFGQIDTVIVADLCIPKRAHLTCVAASDIKKGEGNGEGLVEGVPGNLGKGDFNVYRMFVETALALTRQERVAAQFVPEGLYNGANATAIRSELFDNFRLQKLAGFENTKGLWFPSVHTAAKFCLYVAWRDGRTERFSAAFRINSLEKLAHFSAGRVLSIPTKLVAEFSPDARAVMEFAAQEDIDICTKMYSRFPKFGERIDGQPYRSYMREVDMGNDRELFSEGPDGLSVFEGRMIDTYDYRAKGYASGRGR